MSFITIIRDSTESFLSPSQQMVACVPFCPRTHPKVRLPTSVQNRRPESVSTVRYDFCNQHRVYNLLCSCSPRRATHLYWHLSLQLLPLRTDFSLPRTGSNASVLQLFNIASAHTNHTTLVSSPSHLISQGPMPKAQPEPSRSSLALPHMD